LTRPFALDHLLFPGFVASSNRFKHRFVSRCEAGRNTEKQGKYGEFAFMQTIETASGSPPLSMPLSMPLSIALSMRIYGGFQLDQHGKNACGVGVSLLLVDACPDTCPALLASALSIRFCGRFERAKKRRKRLRRRHFFVIPN
jgi:hypothetical protein